MLGHHTGIHTGSVSPAYLLDKLIALKRAACNGFHGGLVVHVHVLAAIEDTYMTRLTGPLPVNKAWTLRIHPNGIHYKLS